MTDYRFSKKLESPDMLCELSPLLTVLGYFCATLFSVECVVSSLLASSLSSLCCFCTSSSLSLRCLSFLLLCMSVAVSPNSNSVGVSLGTSIFLILLPFLGPIFLFKSSICQKQKPINKSAHLESSQ